MNLRNTVFWSEQEDYRKVWDNKDYFPLVHKKIEEMDKALKEVGIKKVIAFDQIGERWEDWACEESLTLAVLPICNVIDQRGTRTKDFLRGRGFKAKEKFVAVDIETSEEVETAGFVYWFPTRNLVISTVNPFLDKKVLELILHDIDSLNVKFMSQEEIWDYKLRNQWMLKFENREGVLKNKIEEIKVRLESLRNGTLEKSQELLLSKIELDKLGEIKGDVTTYIKEEMEGIKKLPFIKEIKIRDKIYVNFGTVYVTGGVVVSEENGHPKVEPRKVEIGELTFTIGSGEVKVENPKKVEQYEHPHAENGRICFGEIGNEISRLLGSMELAKLIKLLYSWAFSYNEEDSYCKLQRFYGEREKQNANK